jgi:hypothetical protein
MDTDNLTSAQKLALAGGVLAAVGAVLPWVSAGPFSASGIDGDGMFTLVFGIAAGAIVLLRDWETMDILGVGLMGLLTLLIAGNTYNNLSSMGGATGGSNFTINLSAGLGLHLTLIAGILLIAAGVQGYRNDNSQPAQQQFADSP